MMSWAKVHKSFWARSQSCETRLLASSYLSVRPSVGVSLSPHEIGPHKADFHEISYSGIFRKYVEQIQVSFKSDINSGSLPEYLNLFVISRSNMHRMRNVSDTIVEKPKHARILCSISFYFKKIV